MVFAYSEFRESWFCTSVEAWHGLYHVGAGMDLDEDTDADNLPFVTGWKLRVA